MVSEAFGKIDGGGVIDGFNVQLGETADGTPIIVAGLFQGGKSTEQHKFTDASFLRKLAIEFLQGAEALELAERRNAAKAERRAAEALTS